MSNGAVGVSSADAGNLLCSNIGTSNGINSNYVGLLSICCKYPDFMNFP